jgi:hypothetical protein
MRNRAPPKEFPPTISFEYNQPPPPKKQSNFIGDKPLDVYAHATYVRPDIISGLNYQSMYNPYYGAAAQGYIPPVVVKNYTINGDGLTGDQQRLSIIYEDILPSRKFSPSYTTLGERINDYHFIRASIFNNSDGEDIDLHGMSTNSLTSYIKIDVADINPYNSYKHSPNPFKGLPQNFLIYRSGYPIRHDEKTGRVECAKDSTSVNVRLYKMLEGSWLVNRINTNKKTNKKKFFDYDEWREVAFYEYIRENILKKKVSPNFVNMYGYFISENSMIDYDKIDYSYNEINNDNNNRKVEEQYLVVKPEKVEKNVYEIDEDKHNINGPIIDQYGNYMVPSYVDPTGMTGMTMTKNMGGLNFQSGLTEYGKIVKHKELAENFNSAMKEKIELQKEHSDKKVITMDAERHIIEVNPDAYLGKSLVILTESPTYSIFGWASKTYLENGNIFEMVGRGYHDVNTWMNILFQLMIALYVMQINKMFISNFDIERNVFVKDLSFRGTATEYWKYKINGVDYYVPNLGYLVMIDSNFGDVEFENNNANSFIEKECHHKLNGDFYNEGIPSYSREYINNNIFEMFIKSFDSNVFGRYSKKYGIVQPPDEIIDLMGKIMNEASSDKEKNIEKYIIKYMKKFIHNRVGSYLKESEISNIRRDDVGEPKKGDILVHEAGNNKFKFVIYLGVDNNIATIITKENPENSDYIDKKVNVHSLINYMKTEPISQNYKPNEENLTEEGLLETYIINKQ